MTYLNRFLTALALALVGAVGFSGCDFTGGYDEDPNQATDASAQLVLNSTAVANILLQEGNLARAASIFSGHLTGSDRQYQSLERYSQVPNDNNGEWNLAYVDVIAQAAIVKQKAREVNNRVLDGIAMVLEAQAYGTMTALFGDIPFTQANQPEAFPNPVFDAQADIYAALQDSLSAAIEDLDSEVGAPVDIYLNGDPIAWSDVAHTLKARYYLHVGNYEMALSEAQEGIQSPEDNLVAPHGTSPYADQNTFYQFTARERVEYLTANSSYLSQLIDPGSDVYRGGDETDESARYAFYFQTDLSGDGNLDPNFCNGEGAPAGDCTGPGFFAQDAPYPLVTYIENQLILAEAILQTGGSEDDALEALNSVRSVLAERYPDGEYEAYEDDDFDSANDLLMEILEEKYVSLYAQIEAFNDVRRTDNFIGVPPKTGNQLPQRFVYALSEINTNSNAPSQEEAPQVMVDTPVNAALDYSGVQ